MSTPPFDVVRRERTYFREIDNHHNLQLTAKSAQQSEKHHKQMALAQAKQADAAVRLSIAQGEANSISRAELEQMEVISRGVHDVVYAVENLGEDVARNTEAVTTLSGIVAHGLQQFSQQSAQQHQEAVEIARNPLRNQARELAKQAGGLLKLGAEHEGRPDQIALYKEAMQALLEVTKNPIGNRDYITCFHIGFLGWKSEGNLAEAERAFDRARLLSLGAKDVWHISAIRHLAEMQHLQGRHEEAYTTIQEALLLGRDYNLLFDAARYLARAGRLDDYVGILGDCITLRPTTIVTMFGEPDFTATPANEAALYQLEDRLRQRLRAETRQSLIQWRHLLDLKNQVERMAEITIQLPPIWGYKTDEITEEEKKIDSTDFLKLLAFRATIREAIELLDKTIKQTLESKLKDNQVAENQAQTKLDNALESIDRRLAEVRREKEGAENCVSNARRYVSLPEKPFFGYTISSEDKRTMGPRGMLLTALFFPLLILGDKKASFVDAFIFFIVLLLILFPIPVIASEMWRSTCDKLKNKAEAEAKQRLAGINAAYPEKMRDIGATRDTEIPLLEKALHEVRARKARLVDAIELFRTG